MVPNGLPEPRLSSKEMISLLEREGLTVASGRDSHCTALTTKLTGEQWADSTGRRNTGACRQE
jgi:hypothetical protein